MTAGPPASQRDAADAGANARADGPRRWEKHARHVRWGYAGFASFSLASAGVAIGWSFAFYLAQPPMSAGVIVLLALLLPLPMMAGAGFLACMCWAYTRPDWGRWLEGSVFCDNRWPWRRAPFDLAAVDSAVVSASVTEDDSTLYLILKPRGGRLTRIVLGGSASRFSADRQLATALADALAEHPDQAVAGQAVADLRELACMKPAELGPWISARVSRPTAASQ